METIRNGKKFGEETPILEKQYNFPDELNPRDIGLIKEQCIIQNATSKEQVEEFANAYLEAKKLAENKEELKLLDENKVLDLIMHWAGMIEKEANIKLIEGKDRVSFRIVPVTFADGKFGVQHRHIERAMEFFCKDFVENDSTPEEFYKRFEEIHPFEDGNGRIGDLLWKIAVARNTGEWPYKLPPEIFNQNKGNKY